jgi:hypothetical protein
LPVAARRNQQQSQTPCPASQRQWSLAPHLPARISRRRSDDFARFLRIAVDWLLMSDIGEVIKKVVDLEKFPDYQIPKKTTGQKKRRGGLLK